MNRPDVCRYNHPDCFALSLNHTCLALRDTYFTKDCPFYKNEAQRDEERFGKRRDEDVRVQR